MTEGMIFRIDHTAASDGRPHSTVFFKGCPLRCSWCHTPEGLMQRRQLAYNTEACTTCGACVSVCPKNCHSLRGGQHVLDHYACTLCARCTAVCPTGALSFCGRRVLDSFLLSDVTHHGSAGITLSGGEPLMQPDFALALARGARKRGLSVTVETSGAADSAVLEQIAPCTDLFCFDFKHHDPAQLKRFTGADHAQILGNLRLLHTLGRPVILCCPIIPGCNDTSAHYAAIAALANEMENICRIRLLPATFPRARYADLGMRTDYAGASLPPADAEQIAEAIRALTETPIEIA